MQQVNPVSPPPPAYDRKRTYAEWFAWARSQVQDPARCHAAAAAAVHDIENGRPMPVVTETAAKIAQGASSIAPEAAPHEKAYAGWFAWSNLVMKQDKERSHAAAAAAVQAEAQGLTSAQAADAAMRAVGAPPATATSVGARRFNDRAWWNLGWGVAALILPFFGWVLPIAPIIGLIWGWRVLKVSRRPLVYVAIGVNCLALVVTVLAFVIR